MSRREWIPIDRYFHESREALVLARELKIEPDLAVGIYVRFMSWVDGETIDGWLADVGPADVDGVMNRTGFAAAMIRADLMVDRFDGLFVRNFRTQHGPSARARLLTRGRKQRERAKLNPTDSDIPY